MKPLLHNMIAVGGAALWMTPAIAQTNVENPPDPYVQQQTGMSFPEHIGNFLRHQVVRYAADGSDVGIGYELDLDEQKQAYVSMFIYPAPDAAPSQRAGACRELHEGMKRDIVSHEADARLESQSEVASPSPYFKPRGLRATYSGGSANFAATVQPVHEEALLYCFAGQKWLVSYRITWPEKYAASARPEVVKLLQALKWPETLARAN
jgi:hypothetical protein